ncbi:uncharacterized protein EV420DRAFT_1676189 [Desarmillaria tabescens]|uniref:INO80 complex subunit B-like conserved region domain-containing protein n=1 Tax=Armillaria tabescens TaxID=1929756 RepID=A0AA39KEY4_ARMTA|nr:uncharacterized protein EV420DRAFT_1676189 [Desarmillaria tabescens]KAK0459865.1 hypothetical protein EV420DRAFT_1676189 [Desarmillaria tabescens]
MRRNEVENEVDMEGADDDAERYEGDSPEEEDGDDPEEEDEDDQVGVTVLDEEDAQSNDDDAIVEEEDDQLSNTSSSQPAQSIATQDQVETPPLYRAQRPTRRHQHRKNITVHQRELSARTRRIVPGTIPTLRAQKMDDNDDDDDESLCHLNRSRHLKLAVLANVVDSSHVSWLQMVTLQYPWARVGKSNSTRPSLALRREETARKRKNLSEKKLEDEKVETINRPTQKTNTSAGRVDATELLLERATPSGVKVQNDSDEEAMEVEGNPGTEEKMDVDDTVPEEKMDVDGAAEKEKTDSNEEKKMILMFSVPPSLLPEGEVHPPAPPRPIPQCNVEGCELNRKYRLVRNWDMGACGMAHLKLLQA